MGFEPGSLVWECDALPTVLVIQILFLELPLENKEIMLTESADGKEYLAKEGYDPKFGARPLKRVIQSKILTPVANMMVGEGVLQSGTVKVTMKKGELDFDIKKKGRRNTKSKAAKTVAKKATKKKEAVAA